MSGGYGRTQATSPMGGPFNVGQVNQMGQNMLSGFSNVPRMLGTPYSPMGQYRQFPVFNPYQAMFQQRLMQSPSYFPRYAPYRPQITRPEPEQVSLFNPSPTPSVGDGHNWNFGGPR